MYFLHLMYYGSILPEIDKVPILLPIPIILISFKIIQDVRSNIPLLPVHDGKNIASNITNDEVISAIISPRL